MTPDLHVGRLFDEAVADHPERTFLRISGGPAFTYGEAGAHVNRLAHSFLEAGIGRGDSVCVMMPNRPEYVFAWMALAKIGGVTVSINTGYKDAGLERMLTTSSATILLVDAQFVEAVARVGESLTALERVVVTGADNGWTPPDGAKLPLERYEDFLGTDQSEALVDVRNGHPLMMVFTSGTTGAPKAVEISHAFMQFMGRDMVELCELSEDDVFFCCYPMYHSEAPVCGVMPALLCQTTIVLSERFSASSFWREIRESGATFFTFLGSVLTILLKQTPRPDDADNPVRTVFGCPVPSVWKEFEERFGVQVFEWYASTEGGFISFDDVTRPHRDGICGVLSPYYEVAIVDEDDNELPRGETGEIVSRSRRPHGQMNGYHGRPDATLEAWRDLWYHSGDLGWLDEDGLLHFSGRKKDVVRRRGVNVSASEVEDTLASHPAVVECAVIGVPADIGEEEEVKAVVLVGDNVDLDVEELFKLAQSRLPRAMVPRYVELVREFPRTPTGKVLKRVLRDGWRTPGTVDGELIVSRPAGGGSAPRARR